MTERGPAIFPEVPPQALRLVFLSAAALYFELALIRYTAAEVLYLGYFSNFMLITAFLGLGVGFLSAGRNLDLDDAMPFGLLFVFALVLVSEFDVGILANRFGEFFFGNVSGRAGLPGAVLLALLFAGTAFFFAGMGNRIARTFAAFPPLIAYSFDIGGSLFGIALFSVQSLSSAGPVTWVITGCLLAALGLLCGRDAPAIRSALRIVVAGACVIVLLMSSDKGVPTIWSRYQKLTVIENRTDNLKIVTANGIPHQFMHPVSAAAQTYYAMPYQLAREAGLELNRVLIIGAGTGTDVAVALHSGALHVDAVEIDGSIVDLGRMLHPDAPYADPRVTVHVTDGRKFLHDPPTEYDLVVFALPDSLMRLSAMSSVRLESYLFTTEAFESVKAHLAPGGIFVLYNQYRWSWLVSKIAGTVERTFGKTPLIIQQGPTTLVAVGASLPGSTYEAGGFERLATDDWPFLYMQRPAVHWLYLGMIAMFLLAALVAVRVLAPQGTLARPDLAFFFMGMAFLLLETKSLAFFSLLFGTTWQVNSMAFFGILLSVLAANLVVQHFRLATTPRLFAALFASLFVAYLLPASSFLGIDDPALRYAGATAVVFAPIFLANLIFSAEFRGTEQSTRAFGWNLLGAVAGGGLEYLSLLAGFRNLLWIVAFCYLAAALDARRRARARA